MLDWIAEIFKYPMQWFYSLTGNNYLLALVLFALFIKVILLPMTIYQQKKQIQGAKLRPKIAIIEKKYQGVTDQAALQQKQQEIMELQQKEGYSPLSGCLPLLIQMPIFLGLYQIVQKPLTYLMNMSQDLVNAVHTKLKASQAFLDAGITADNQIGIINYLNNNPTALESVKGVTAGEEVFSNIPDLVFGPFDLGMVPSVASWLVLIPILTFVLSFLSMKITRWINSPVMTAQSTPESRMSEGCMTWTMPLMGVWICFSVPAAFGVYWLLGYVYGIIQTVILAKAMPLPTFTEEELRQYEKEMKAASKAYRAPNRAMAGSGQIRSRHHIDDDDYIQPAPPAQKGKAGAKKSGVESAPLKDKEN